MRWQYRRVVVASLAVLPAVESLFAPASSCRQTIHSNRWISRAGTRTSSISSSGSNRAPRRAEHESSVPRGTHFRMQDGAGYGTDGEGRQVPPAWNPNREFSDGFGEEVPRLNTVFLTGYLGQDPKPKYFDSGRVVLNLSLAVKREYHPIERKAFGVLYGEEETDWFQLEMWNRDAEYAAKVCKKGGRVGVTGSLSLNAWIDREGKDRTTAKILVQNLEILDSRAEQAERLDRSDANLWESERLQKLDAAALRQQQGEGGGGGMAGAAAGSGGGTLNGEAYQQQSADELEAQARKKAAEDKWWSATPEAPSAASGGGEAAASAGKGGESNWWEEEGEGSGEGRRGAKGIDADSLPSFFDS
ncbi:unnamed protein product [Pylaiella littoralis]